MNFGDYVMAIVLIVMVGIIGFSWALHTGSIGPFVLNDSNINFKDHTVKINSTWGAVCPNPIPFHFEPCRYVPLTNESGGATK